MDNEKLAQTEYESLYKEIDKHSDRISTVINFDIVAFTTLIGVALGKEVIHADSVGFPIVPMILLLPLAVVLPSFLLVTEELNSIARIAAYIRVYYEERTGVVKWQGAIQHIRKEASFKPTQFFRKALRVLLPLMACVSMVLSMIVAFTTKNVPLWLVVLWIALGMTTVVATSFLGQTWEKSGLNVWQTVSESSLRETRLAAVRRVPLQRS